MAFVVYSLRGGGAERVVCRLANYLSASHSVHVILLSKDDAFYVTDDRVIVHKAKYGKSKWFKVVYYIRMLLHIRSIVNRYNIERIFSFGESINSFVLVALLGLRLKKYVSNRASPMSNLKGFRGAVNPFFYPFANRVIVQTEKAAAILQKKYARSDFVVIPNPIEVPSEITPYQSREKIIINVGFLGGRKNQVELLNHFRNLKLADEWTLWFVGGGPNLSRLKALAEELKIHDKVVFWGEQKNVGVFLNQAQIFAFTSETEGFPNALAEAMAHGCACLSYNILTGPSDLINDGVNGRLVCAGKSLDYAQTLDLLTQDENLRVRYSAAARDSVREFSIEKVARKYADLE